MSEKAYKAMGSAGAGSIVIGVIMIVVGVCSRLYDII